MIKDTPLELSSLKAKRRYEINKGLKNFEVRRIRPEKYAEELYSVQVAAFAVYPAKYRPSVDHDSFVCGVSRWTEVMVYGAFFRETGELAGYAWLSKNAENWLEFSVLKTKPEFEKYAVNAALVAQILESNRDFLESGGVICDGSRSVNHETHFQDYLEKYFDFRKAYCDLHIVYNPKVAWVIKMLYPVRRALLRFDENKLVHQVNAVLKMEEIARG